MSDLHGLLPQVDHKIDTICICGDIVPLNIQRDIEESWNWFNTEFEVWVNNLPCKYVVLIAGNHDFFLQVEDVQNRITSNKIYYLQNSSVELEGIKFYGMPYCPNLSKWAFYAPDMILKSYCDHMEMADILLVHCPPKYKTQGVVLEKTFNYGRDFGNIFLTNPILKNKYQYVISGHIHSGNHGIDMLDETACVNVSLLDENYRYKYKPFEFYII